MWTAVVCVTLRSREADLDYTSFHKSACPFALSAEREKFGTLDLCLASIIGTRYGKSHQNYMYKHLSGAVRCMGGVTRRVT